MVMRNRPEDVLALIDGKGVFKPTDWEIIREALEREIARPAFIPLDDWEWLIGRARFPNLIGFGHIHKLLGHPGEQTHCCDLTHQPDPENSRKAVQKSLRRAMDEIASTQPDIGVHLQDNIKTGEHCVYLGNWNWRVSSQ